MPDFCITAGADSNAWPGSSRDEHGPVALELVGVRTTVLIDRPMRIVMIGDGLDDAETRRAVAQFPGALSWETLPELARYLKSSLETAFLAFVTDTDRVAVFGDIFGALPIYFRPSAKRGAVVSSNPDLLGHSDGEPDWDLVSLHDLSMTERICFPFTAYKSVRQLSPTSILTVTAEGAAEIPCGHRIARVQPRHIIDEVAASIETAVGKVSRRDRILIPLSGGLDSRIVLAMAKAATEDVRSFSITSVPSLNSLIAERVAERRKVQHRTIIVRRNRFTGRLAHMSRLVGSQHSMKHGHFLPLARYLRLEGRILIGGYGSNTNLSGYGTLRRMIAKVSTAPDPTIRDELVSRWRAHGKFIERVLAFPSRRLVASWPFSHKKAYAHFQVECRLSKTIEPFNTLFASFSAKAMSDRERPDVQTALFRRYCRDEADIITTAAVPPFEGDIVPIGGNLSRVGWTDKKTLFRVDNEMAVLAASGVRQRIRRQTTGVHQYWTHALA